MLRDRLISDLCPSTGLVVWQGLRKRSFREDRQGSRAGREAKPRGRGTRGAKSLQAQGKGGDEDNRVQGGKGTINTSHRVTHTTVPFWYL